MLDLIFLKQVIKNPVEISYFCYHVKYDGFKISFYNLFLLACPLVPCQYDCFKTYSFLNQEFADFWYYVKHYGSKTKCW